MSILKELELNLNFHFSEVLDYPLAKPYWVYISLSHKCTYRCQMCGVVKILNGYELPEDKLRKTFDTIADWKRDCVVLLTGGEVLLRKDIFDIINYSVSKGLKTEAVSNGSLIDRNMADKIIASGLQNIAVSLDGAKEDTHDAIRQKGAFKKTINALSMLVEAKKRLGRGPQISAWTTIMKENVGELFDIIPLVKDLGVECLVYHPVIVSQDDMQNTSPNAPFWIRGQGLEILKKQIDKIIDYQKKNGLVAFLHNPYMWINYFEGTVRKGDWKCNPFVFMNIGPDGEARSCGAAFGNINEIDLDQCLLTPEAFKARQVMKACQKPCLQTCWAHPESDSLKAIIDNFADKLKNNKDKKKYLKSALKMLKRYENMLINYKNA